MFFPLDDFVAFFVPDSVSTVAAAGSAARTHAIVFLLAICAVFTAAPRAKAETRWNADDSAGILFVTDAGMETRWLEFPRVQLLAFRDEWYGTSDHRLAQAQPADAQESNEPVILPPPVNYQQQPAQTVGPADALPPVPTAEPALNEPAPMTGDGSGDPTQPEQSGGIVTEVPDEPPAEEDEKPAVPDLAKGILIMTNDGDLTFKPGVRIQPRYMYEQGNDNHDFLIRRFRLKGGGNAFDVAKYGVELKIDSEGRFAATPSARVENAWLDFPVETDLMYLRVGLYDIPFSRDALTSDSKLLFMDRSLIKEELTGVGFADNTIGVMLHGRPDCGRYEYMFGVFDSVVYERFGVAGTRESDDLMPGGRFVVSLLDPQSTLDGYADYLGSYLGKGQRLDIGINAVHLSDALDAATTLDLSAWGVDLFYNTGPYTFQTEYDQILENVDGGVDIFADGWYVQGGYLFNPCDPCLEFALRYQELDPLVGDTLQWTSVGFNWYIREHNLKVQTDYTFRSDTVGTVIPGGIGLFDEDVFQIQLQLDF
jgi:hypothetical protein